MNDQQIITSAYEAAIKQLYMVFYGEFIAAQSPNSQQQAEQRFVDGVVLARQIRDRALTLLP